MKQRFQILRSNMENLTAKNIPLGTSFLSVANKKTDTRLDFTIRTSDGVYIWIYYTPEFDQKQSLSCGVIGPDGKFHACQGPANNAGEGTSIAAAFNFFWELATDTRQDRRTFEDFPSFEHYIFKVLK